MPCRCLRLRRGRRCRRARRCGRLRGAPCRSCRASCPDVVDDRALLADELVVERRLADVRAAEDRDANRVVAAPPRDDPGSRVDDLVEQVAGVRAVQARDRERIAEPKAVELVARACSAAGSSTLFATTSTSFFDSRRICASSSSPGVIPWRASTMKSTRSASRDRRARLLGDLARDRMRVGDVDTAGVDRHELLAEPLDDQLLAVARRAARVVHDRGARRGQPVDERRLPDVREADDRDRAYEIDRLRRSLLDFRVISSVIQVAPSPSAALLVHVGEPVEEHVDAPLDLAVASL